VAPHFQQFARIFKEQIEELQRLRKIDQKTTVKEKQYHRSVLPPALQAIVKAFRPKHMWNMGGRMAGEIDLAPDTMYDEIKKNRRWVSGIKGYKASLFQEEASYILLNIEIRG